MENIQLGLLLMVVGMTAVFVILLLVIYLGKGLIAFVNKFAPELAVQKQTHRQAQATLTHSADAVSGETTAAIVSAISIITGGKGRITKIEKQ